MLFSWLWYKVWQDFVLSKHKANVAVQMSAVSAIPAGKNCIDKHMLCFGDGLCWFCV